MTKRYLPAAVCYEYRERQKSPETNTQTVTTSLVATTLVFILYRIHMSTFGTSISADCRASRLRRVPKFYLQLPQCRPLLGGGERHCSLLVSLASCFLLRIATSSWPGPNSPPLLPPPLMQDRTRTSAHPRYLYGIGCRNLPSIPSPR